MARIFDQDKKSSSGYQDKEEEKNNGLKMNLIKDELTNVFNWKKNITVALVLAFFSIILINFAYFGISFWGTYEQEKVVGEVVDPKKIIELNNDINEARKKVQAIEVFESRMIKTEKLISSHIYWSNFFDFLQTNTLSQIHYDSFSGGIDGQYSLQSYAQDYSAIDAQIKQLLENKYVLDAKVASASSDLGETGEEIDFTLNLVIDPSLFINYQK